MLFLSQHFWQLLSASLPFHLNFHNEPHFYHDVGNEIRQHLYIHAEPFQNRAWQLLIPFIQDLCLRPVDTFLLSNPKNHLLFNFAYHNFLRDLTWHIKMHENEYFKNLEQQSPEIRSGFKFIFSLILISMLFFQIRQHLL